jgi:hypothetical protein
MSGSQQRPVDWDLVSVVRSSKHRRSVFEAVAEQPRCASEIAEGSELDRESVSRWLRDLKQREPPLVECLTPTRPHHRIYGLTRDGEAVAEQL